MKKKGFLQAVFDLNARVCKAINYPASWAAMMVPAPVGIVAAAVLAVPSIPFRVIDRAIEATAKIARRPLNTDARYND